MDEHEKVSRVLNWTAVEYARHYEVLRCVVCEKAITKTEGMYSWPITHGHPTMAVTVVFSCPEHTTEERDAAASMQFGWMLTPGASPP